MSTYVMSDIHGCYSDFLSMLDKINFSDTDQLIMAGDYIDKGKQSYEMLKWIEHCPSNIRLIRGNHEEEFAAYVDFMLLLDRKKELGTDFNSNKDTIALYESIKYFIKCNALPVSYFDAYGTIGSLLEYHHITLNDLCQYSDIIHEMPYYQELKINNKIYIVVHAGYAENLKDISTKFSNLENFYLYARKESYQLGGKQNRIIIAGHTPTIVQREFAYNKGNVFRYYDKTKNCTFYDIDCGCVFRGRESDAKLACIQLENEEIFYV